MNATDNSESETDTLYFVSLAIFSLIGAVGIIGNVFVLFVVFAVKELRSFTNIFLINQSFIDALVSLFLFGNFVVPPLPLPDQKWSGIFICCIWNSAYIFWGTTIASTYNLVMLSLERYFAVIHPVAYRSKFTYRVAVAVAVAPWIIGYGFEIHWAAANHFTNGQCTIQYANSIVPILTGCLAFIVEFLLPVILMAFVYVRIWKSLRLRVGDRPTNSSTAMTTVSIDGNTNNRRNTQDQPTGSNYRDKARDNVIKTLFIVCITYTICWAPNQITYFYYNLGGDIDVNGRVFSLTVYIAFLNMCVNPFIYTFKYRKFQNGTKNLFRKL